MVDANTLLTAGGIFVLRVVGNMITTVRLVLIVRGQKMPASLLAILETLIFAVALGSVVSNLNNVWNLGAYSVGFAVGGYLGMTVEQRLIQRFVSVHVISPQLSHEIAVAIRAAGFGATETYGQGAQGQVGAVTAVVKHQDVGTVVKEIHRVDPHAFVMLEELRGISHGYFRRFNRHER